MCNRECSIWRTGKKNSPRFLSPRIYFFCTGIVCRQLNLNSGCASMVAAPQLMMANTAVIESFECTTVRKNNNECPLFFA